MKYYFSSKTLQISLGISILLHIFVFIFIKTPKPFQQMESPPVSIEYFSEERAQHNEGATKKVTSRPEVYDREPQPPKDMVASAQVVPERSSSIEAPINEVENESVKFPIMRENEKPEEHVKPDLFSFREKNDGTVERNSSGEESLQEEATVSLQEPDIAFESYIRKVGEKIEGVWKYPEAAKRAGLQGRGIISFTINRQGELVDVKILNSSGYPVLDEGIIEAIRKAAKYYPFQKNMSVKLLHIEATFEYHLVSPGYIWIR